MPETRVECPHCEGTGNGPQRGAWGAALTASGRLPRECQNCMGFGFITEPAGRTEADGA